MAKPIKIWSGTEWVDVAVSIPNLSQFVTATSLSDHESDTTNVHGIADTSVLATQSDINSITDLTFQTSSAQKISVADSAYYDMLTIESVASAGTYARLRINQANQYVGISSVNGNGTHFLNITPTGLETNKPITILSENVATESYVDNAVSDKATNDDVISLILALG